MGVFHVSFPVCSFLFFFLPVEDVHAQKRFFPREIVPDKVEVAVVLCQVLDLSITIWGSLKERKGERSEHTLFCLQANKHDKKEEEEEKSDESTCWNCFLERVVGGNSSSEVSCLVAFGRCDIVSWRRVRPGVSMG
jgi:hypothetical protein